MEKLLIPFLKYSPHLGWFAVIFFMFVIVGCSNAVNLDGWSGWPCDWMHDRRVDDLRDFRLRGGTRSVCEALV